METDFRLAKNIFFRVGERLAIIPVIAVFVLLFFIETTHVAFSQSEETYPGYSKNGITYDYYLNSSYSSSISDFALDIILNHSTESTLSHHIFIDPKDNEIWEKLAQCESKANWGINTGNGYYGGLQFTEGSWHSVGGSGLAHEASKDEQIMRGKLLQERRGWGVWGACAKKLGLI